MTAKRLALLSSFLLGALPVLAKSATPIVADAQAISVLQASVKIMGGLPTDSVATGSVQIAAGSQSSQGTVRILTKGFSESFVQLTTPDMTRTTIYANGQASSIVGSTTDPLSLELAVTSQAAEFPLPLLVALLSNPDTSIQYMGLETSTGASLQHIRTWNSFASQPNFADLSSFSTRDIWIDASSGLPQRISYTRRPAHGAVAWVAVDVFYSNYQNSEGMLYPSAIQESRNGTPWATIAIQNVSLNTGLTDSDFPIQ